MSETQRADGIERMKQASTAELIGVLKGPWNVDHADAREAAVHRLRGLASFRRKVDGLVEDARQGYITDRDAIVEIASELEHLRRRLLPDGEVEGG